MSKLGCANLNKSINAICICKKVLSTVNLLSVIIDPCEHIIHKKCLFKHLKLNKTTCPICDTHITLIHSEKSLKKDIIDDKSLYQKYIDLICVKNIDDKSNINIDDIIKAVPLLPKVLSELLISRNTSQINQLGETLFSMANAKLTVNGLDKIDFTENCVFISNHTTHFDSIVLLYLLKCGFLISTEMNESFIYNCIVKIASVITIDRGNETNTVEKIKEFVDSGKSICLFPEGMITHPDTIGRFRTGAFNIGKPIYPIIIKYNPPIYDNSIINFILKIPCNENFDISVTILDKEIGPFNNERIEEIRYKMATAGNFALSRVSNRDIKDCNE